MLFAATRERKSRDVTRGMRESRGRDADQGAVWSGTAEASQSLGVKSATGAMSDAYTRHDVSLEEYERAFAAVPGQIGVMFATGGEVVGLDLFDHSATLHAYLPKLVRAAALEGLAYGGQQRRPDGSSKASSVDSRALTHRAAGFLERVAAMPVSEHPAVGLGLDLRLETEEVAGGALEYLGNRTSKPPGANCARNSTSTSSIREMSCSRPRIRAPLPQLRSSE